MTYNSRTRRRLLITLLAVGVVAAFYLVPCVLIMHSSLAPKRKVGPTPCDSGLTCEVIHFNSHLRFRRGLVVRWAHDHRLRVGRPSVILSSIVSVAAPKFGHDVRIPPDWYQVCAPRRQRISAGVLRVLIGKEKIPQAEMTSRDTVGGVPHLSAYFRKDLRRSIVGGLGLIYSIAPGGLGSGTTASRPGPCPLASDRKDKYRKRNAGRRRHDLKDFHRPPPVLTGG